MKQPFALSVSFMLERITLNVFFVVAGLLSAFHLTQNKVLLHKANDLGDRLVHCFDSPSKSVPFSDVNLKTKSARGPSWSMDSSLSEVSSMQIEFRDLAYETHNKIYEVIDFVLD